MKPFKARTFLKLTVISKLVLVVTLIGMIFSAPVAAQITEKVVPDTTITSQDTSLTKNDSTFNAESEFPFDFNPKNQVDITALLLKTFGYFLLIVVLIWGVVYILKNFVYTKKGVQRSNDMVTVLNSTFVAPKKSIMVVEAVGKILMLGVTDDNMNVLSEISKEEYLAYLESEKSETPAVSESQINFGEIFTKMMGKNK